MSSLPDLTPAELKLFTEKFGLAGPLVRLPSVGIVNRVYSALWQGRRVVLRVPMPGDAEDTLTESVAVPAAFQAGVRTPELLIFDDDRDVVDAPVTVYAFALGRSLDALAWRPSDPRWLRAQRETGRELAALHANVRDVPDPNGWLEDTSGHLNPQRTRQCVTEAYRLGNLEAEWVAQTLERLQRDAPPPDPASPAGQAFLHNDLHAGNLMVTEEGAVTALIDWGDAGWGDPALDLCYGGPLAVPELLRGYREVALGALGEGAELRVLAYLLQDAARALLHTPTSAEPDLWYSRPGTALMQLLRVAGQFPVWADYLHDLR